MQRKSRLQTSREEGWLEREDRQKHGEERRRDEHEEERRGTTANVRCVHVRLWISLLYPFVPTC